MEKRANRFAFISISHTHHSKNIKSYDIAIVCRKEELKCIYIDKNLRVEKRLFPHINNELKLYVDIFNYLAS